MNWIWEQQYRIREMKGIVNINISPMIYIINQKNTYMMC